MWSQRKYAVERCLDAIKSLVPVDFKGFSLIAMFN